MPQQNKVFLITLAQSLWKKKNYYGIFSVSTPIFRQIISFLYIPCREGCDRQKVLKKLESVFPTPSP